MIVGDLGRLSYKTDSLQLRKEVTEHHHNFFEYADWDGKPIDLLTIGDSYSNGGGGQYYQDLLASSQDLRILNIQQLPQTTSYLETVVVLANSGLLSSINPTSILVESVERETMNRFTHLLDTTLTEDYNTTLRSLQELHYFVQKQQRVLFINTANYKALLYKLLYRYDDNAYDSQVYISPLKKKFFSSEDAYSLLFFYKDLSYLTTSTSAKIQQLNQNFNDLASLLQKHNITLYFMPAVDKSNLYAPYLKKSTYPQSKLFEELSLLPKHYTMVNSKAILTKALHQGTKDIFYADDTHWTPEASKRIFTEVTFPKH